MDQPGFDSRWIEYALHAPTDYEVMRRICAELPNKDAFQPDYGILSRFCPPSEKPCRILDFGAGMLRNTKGLLEMSSNWHVVAYDSSAMLSRGLNHFGSTLDLSRMTLATNWNKLRTEHFDIVIGVLVFQHIHPTPLRTIIRDLTQMTSRLCVFGRRAHDDYVHENWTSVWPLILEYWSPVEIFTKGVAHPSESLSSETRARLLNGDRHDHTGAIFQPALER